MWPTASSVVCDYHDRIHYSNRPATTVALHAHLVGGRGDTIPDEISREWVSEGVTEKLTKALVSIAAPPLEGSRKSESAVVVCAAAPVAEGRGCSRSSCGFYGHAAELW